MANERVFYLLEDEEYEKYSGFTYEKIIEDYILIERFVYEEGSKRGGVWGISETEKWKLMNVITAYNLVTALYCHDADLYSGYVEKEWIIKYIDEEVDFYWQKISTIPLYKLLQLNQTEEPLLVIIRIKTIAKQFLEELDWCTWEESINIRYDMEILRILGVNEEHHYEKLTKIFEMRTLKADWKYRDPEKEEERLDMF